MLFLWRAVCEKSYEQRSRSQAVASMLGPCGLVLYPSFRFTFVEMLLHDADRRKRCKSRRWNRKQKNFRLTTKPWRYLIVIFIFSCCYLVGWQEGHNVACKKNPAPAICKRSCLGDLWSVFLFFNDSSRRWRRASSLFAWCLTALSAQIGYIVP